MQLFNTLISAFLLTAAAIAQSDVKVHVVQVGLNGSLAFSPDSITANPGEIVQFQFMAKVTFYPTNILLYTGMLINVIMVEPLRRPISLLFSLRTHQHRHVKRHWLQVWLHARLEQYPRLLAYGQRHQARLGLLQPDGSLREGYGFCY